VLSLVERLVHPPVNFLLRQIGAAREFAGHLVAVAVYELQNFGRHEAIDDDERRFRIGLRQEAVRLYCEQIGIARARAHEGDATAVGECGGWSFAFVFVQGRQVRRVGNAPFVAVGFLAVVVAVRRRRRGSREERTAAG